MPGNKPFVLPLSTPEVSLDVVGGKGQALAKLQVADFPVPEGFLITTGAYARFVEDNTLQGTILDTVNAAQLANAESAETTATSVRTLFEQASLPADIEASVRQAYATLPGEPVVSVRSSATAEDLPDLSFAGQHDSFLNVRSADEVVVAVRRCWASLWSARALSYRDRMNIEHASLAMGVVVQVMVDADVAGVLFTANPNSGDRAELVINASPGLGEALVGGEVTPEVHVLERTGLTSRQTTTVDGGEPVLSTAVAQELAALCLQVEALFDGQPQDIEWAVADGHCWLLQSRPITHLPETANVEWLPPSGAAKLVRRQIVENMPEPLSPLFEELYLGEGLDRGIDQFMSIMGLPFNLDDFITRPMFVTVNGYGYCCYDIRPSWRMLLLIPRILWWYIRYLPRFLKNLMPMWQDEGLPAYLATIDQWKSVELADASDDDLLRGIRTLAWADAGYWFYITMMVGAAKITEGMLNWLLSSRAVKEPLSSGMFLRGFASRTLQAQQDLAMFAAKISSDETLRCKVLDATAGELLEVLRQQPEGRELLEAFNRHIENYGHQVFNLDFVEPTQGERPLAVLISLQALVRDAGDGDTTADDAATLAAEQEALTQRTSASLGRVRRWLFVRFLAWARKFGPYREEALFYMGAAWPALRRLAGELGERLVAAGTLATAEQVYFLKRTELAEACTARGQHRACRGLLEIAQARQQLRESRKRLHPPGRVPEDLRFKYGPFDFTRYFEVWETQKRNAPDTGTLHGFAVSPGTVTGIASVIHSPADFAGMQADTILVCPTTTPAWTPLFAQARGLVTDIGGILAHGSIVAREYGIPAVLGTGNVTQRVVSGQRIKVDGNRGTVTIIE